MVVSAKRILVPIHFIPSIKHFKKGSKTLFHINNLDGKSNSSQPIKSPISRTLVCILFLTWSFCQFGILPEKILSQNIEVTESIIPQTSVSKSDRIFILF